MFFCLKKVSVETTKESHLAVLEILNRSEQKGEVSISTKR